MLRLRRLKLEGVRRVIVREMKIERGKVHGEGILEMERDWFD
jgi:hypothetical protein